MTKDELDSSFVEKRGAIIAFLRKKKVHHGEAEDLAQEVYLKALEGIEYERVPIKYAFSWWIYKVRAQLQKTKAKKENGQHIEQLFYLIQDNHVEQEVTPERALSIVEGYWSSLSRFKQCRMRKEWQATGRPLPAFMKKKIGV